MDFEKYKIHLINNFLPEYKDLYSERDLKVAGWNMLLDEIFSPIIMKELGMRYIGNRVWADDYCNHRRRVLSLFQQTDLGGCFCWGWNFDFIPKMSAGKAVYARTDKSLISHISENCNSNHNTTDKRFIKKPEMFFNRCSIDSADFENSMNKKIKEHIDAFYLTLPLIKTFFHETETYEQTIKMIDSLLDDEYYQLIQGKYLRLTKIFLQQYIGIGKDNEEKLRALFGSESTRESFLIKFSKIPKDYKE